VAFFDAFQARTACESLEAEEIRFVVKDLSEPQEEFRRFRERPPILLEISVNAEDVERAQACLRMTMGLFPEREVVAQDETELLSDQDVLIQAIVCDAREDAEAACNALTEHRISSVIRENKYDDDETGYSVEVKAGEIERATSLIDEWLKLKG
jgi:hypothetical protein